MFRGIDADGQESLLALRSGSAWGHHHNDDGSIQFFAKGRAMIVDSAFGEVQVNARKKFEAAGHSRWTLRQSEPVNHLWRFTRGWIVESALEGPLAFAICYSPVMLVRCSEFPAIPARSPIAHFRTIVQITPAVYLVIDVTDSEQDQSIFFHVPGTGHAQIGAEGVEIPFSEDWRRGPRRFCSLPDRRATAGRACAPDFDGRRRLVDPRQGFGSKPEAGIGAGIGAGRSSHAGNPQIEGWE
jgi:hypothetical protein